MKFINYKLLGLCISSCISWSTYAEEKSNLTVPKDRGGPRFISADNDYAFLKDEKNRNDQFLEKFKYINLDDNPDSYLTIGGEVRYYYQHWDHFTHGVRDNDKNSSLQQRLKLYADYHFDSKKRVFLEIGDNWEFDAEIKSKINYSPFDVQQIFVDYGEELNADSTVKLRLGRFYMPMNSGVLLATRDGANVWYAYDGVKVDLDFKKDIKLEGFYTHPVEFKNGSFNNGTEKEIQIYGISMNKKIDKNNMELYYFSKDNHDIDHNRGSLGLRFYGNNGKLSYDVEGIHQSGHIAQSDISAYGLFLRSNYQVDKNIKLGLRFNYFSGDSNLNDKENKTFESISPGPAYISTTGLFSLKNLFQKEVFLQYIFNEKANVKFSGSILDKANKNDHIYYGGAGVALGKPLSSNKDIAKLYDILFNLKLNQNFNFMLNYTYIEADSALKEIGGENSNYFGVISQFKF